VHDGDEDDNDNLEEAISASVHIVYRRELERLLVVAETKMADAVDGLQAVKAHVSAWLTQLSFGMLWIKSEVSTENAEYMQKMLELRLRA
jgi:hypothetical protein